jgi:hypothetical protein
MYPLEWIKGDEHLLFYLAVPSLLRPLWDTQLEWPEVFPAPLPTFFFLRRKTREWITQCVLPLVVSIGFDTRGREFDSLDGLQKNFLVSRFNE